MPPAIAPALELEAEEVLPLAPPGLELSDALAGTVIVVLATLRAEVIMRVGGRRRKKAIRY